MKSGKALKNSNSTNPEGVERLIAPGVNPGFGGPMIPGIPGPLFVEPLSTINDCL
jgi:hypothetical protein